MRTLGCVLGLTMIVAGCGGGGDETAEGPAFKPVASSLELMTAIIQPAADVYWGSVSTVIDREGTHENFPRTDAEWEAVWRAAMTISESGNLLLMRPPADEAPAWMRYSADLVDIGLEAAKAAESKDPEQVLAAGEKVYYVCSGCHDQYLVESSFDVPR